ncbi:hypothetical protein [Campylobacter sp. CCS1377]|uniref:Uncharacterized protein n=1 Tax=Campylobacter sp. CCS1377 TaxID=3158229 RepID=A0AAU7EAJ7_9BACT
MNAMLLSSGWGYSIDTGNGIKEFKYQKITTQSLGFNINITNLGVPKNKKIFYIIEATAIYDGRNAIVFCKDITSNDLIVMDKSCKANEIIKLKGYHTTNGVITYLESMLANNISTYKKSFKNIKVEFYWD